jgi:hypothetical protein
MFCEKTRQELIRVSIGSDAYDQLSPEQQVEHGYRIDEVLKKAIEREPDKFQDGAFIFQNRRKFKKA